MDSRGSRLWLVILGCVLAVGFWVFLFKDALFSSANPFDSVVGSEIPASRIFLTDDSESDLHSELRARFDANPELRYALVSFWATWCAPCVEELPQLEAVAGDYAARGMDIVLLNFDTALSPEQRAKVVEWHSRYAPSLVSFFDPRDQTTQSLGLSALPFNAVVDRDLTWRWGAYGLVDFKLLEREFIGRARE